jgi:hypothetical protein
VEAVTDSTITLEGRAFDFGELSTAPEQPIEGASSLNTVLAVTVTALVVGAALVISAVSSGLP